MHKKYYIFILLFICFTEYFFGQVQPEFESVRLRFVSEGFGFTYDQAEISDINTFLSNHGQPMDIVETVLFRGDGITNKMITLIYERVEVSFQVVIREQTPNAPFSILWTIRSRDGISYLYNIRHGMTREELEEIIGITEIIQGTTIWLHGNARNATAFLIRDNRIESIIWQYDIGEK